MSDILIVGRNNLLGVQIAAGLLESTQQHIVWMVENLDSFIADELMTSVQEAFSHMTKNQNPTVKPSLKERLSLVEWQSEHEQGIKAQEAWFLAGKESNRTGQDVLQRALQVMAASGARTLNYVGSIYDCPRGAPDHNGWLQLSVEERAVADFCAER